VNDVVLKAVADESPETHVSDGMAAALCQRVALRHRENLDTMSMASRMFTL
jgi:hypothetical protein